MSDSKGSEVNILGIRHHGPGSARSVVQAFDALSPDIILIEGPPDATDNLLALAAHEQMMPPVALLIYMPDEPERAVYYPFAEFSPEWQSILYGLRHNIPARFIDLPQAQWLTWRQSQSAELEPADAQSKFESDPLRLIAQAAGFSDSERWWEYLVEQRRDSTDLFNAVLELMTAAREDAERAHPADRETLLREAHMRQAIRAAQHEGYRRIAVVCGAWHAPALDASTNPKADADLLKGLDKVKVRATWVPWTYGRLSNWSGYGAGIESPGYYHHLWTTPRDMTAHWMARVAHLLREQDMDASPASVIEAVRLAESLSTLRGCPLPGLPELNEAVRAVFCFGSDLPMQLIAEKLIVGEVLGQVPHTTPMLPLQQDLQREQKRLKLPPEATPRALDLDLRNPNALERSTLLHRLNLLGVPWGRLEQASGAKGTFHELWQLHWQPELAIAVIEANVWDNTVLDAATERARDAAGRSDQLPELTALVEQTLLAELPGAIHDVMARLQNVAAVTRDIPLLMDALPPLASVLRYGNVRQMDTGMVGRVVDGLVTRICIGLPAGCAALNDEAAQSMHARLINMHGAMALIGANSLQSLQTLWNQTLARLADQQGLHGLLAGRCCRLLFDQGAMAAEDVARRMGLALSPANEPAQVAAWIEGFLSGSGLLLLHNGALWQILDAWVAALNGDVFTQVLPLLRRTFSTFPAPERRQMGERAIRETSDWGLQIGQDDEEIDAERAKMVLPFVARLLGLENGTQDPIPDP